MDVSLIGKLKNYNSRLFIGSIEDGNGIEVTAFIEGTVLKKAKFRCFGCDSLRITTSDFLGNLIGKDLGEIDVECTNQKHFGCICPKSIILCKLLHKETAYCEKEQRYFFGDVDRYDVENAILLYNIYTLDEVKKLFHIEQINSAEKMRLLKILKRVIIDYKMTTGCIEGM